MEKENKKSEIIAKTTKFGGIGLDVYSILKQTIGSVAVILILIYFMNKGLPLAIGLLFIFFLILLFVLQIITIKRTSHVNLNATAISSQARPTLSIFPDERILATIPGILKAGLGTRSTAFLGVGKIKTPENAMIITDKHIIFMYVPLPGADQIVSSTDIGMVDFVLAAGDIKNKLNEMVSSRSLQEIVSSSPYNYGYERREIVSVDFSDMMQKVIFRTQDSKVSYTIRDKGDYDNLKVIFHQ